jgi:DNA (cytosine-5)-methyltransferase 1
VERGCDIILAVEERPDAAKVYARNFPLAHMVEADVRDLFDGSAECAPTDRETQLRAQLGDIDVLLAGPPCQGHSDLNNHTRRRDPRNGLYVRVARAAEVLRPMSVVIENVPAIRHDRGSAVPRATAVLERAGYRVATAVVDLLEVGVPQRRRRHILLASRHEGVDPCAILTTRTTCQRHGPRTVGWAIGDLLDIQPKTALDAASLPSPAKTLPDEHGRSRCDEAEAVRRAQP